MESGEAREGALRRGREAAGRAASGRAGQTASKGGREGGRVSQFPRLPDNLSTQFIVFFSFRARTYKISIRGD